MSLEMANTEEHWGNELKLFRRRNHLMQDGAARLLGVSQAYISRLESGSAEPSDRLRRKLRQLMFRPEHWSIIDHVRAMVAHSPHVASLFSKQDDQIIVEAVSEPMKAYSAVFPHVRLGEPMDLEPTSEAHRIMGDMIRAGSFEGRVAYAELVWTWPGNDEHPDMHWKTVQSPLRSETGEWLCHAYHVQISGSEKQRLIAEWGSHINVMRFKDEAVDQIRKTA